MKKYVKSGSWAGIILLLMGMVFGCNDLSEDDLNAVPEKPGTGRVTIKLTDAPFPAEWVEEANISIDWVQLLKYEDDEPEMDDDDDNGNGADNGNGNDDDNGEGDDSFVMLDLEDTLRVNLLDLRNGVTQVLAEADIPAGTYRQIRLHVVEAGIVLDESLLGAGEQSTFDLKVPSGHASGLKILMDPPLEVVEGADAEVLIDFDVSRSFILRGNLHHGPGKVKGFIFKPVVRAVAHVETETGKVSGTVTDGEGDEIENALLTLIEGANDTITSATTDEEGYYRMTGIPPGDYMLTCGKEEFDEASADVTVIAGEETMQDFQLTSTEEVDDEGSGDDGEDDDGDDDNGEGGEE